MNKLATGYVANEFCSVPQFDSNLIKYNLSNQNKSSNSHFNSNMIGNNSLGINFNNSNLNNEILKNLLSSASSFGNSNTSRNYSLGVPTMENDSKVLLNILNQNMIPNANSVNSQSGQSINHMNQYMDILKGNQLSKQDFGNSLNNQNVFNQLLNQNSQPNNKSPYENLVQNIGNDFLKKRMRENDTVYNMNMLSNVNNNLSDGNNWMSKNSTNDLSSSGLINNSQNILYNFIHGNNIPHNVNDTKQI